MSESCENMDSESQESGCQQRSPGRLKLYPPVDLQESARSRQGNGKMIENKSEMTDHNTLIFCCCSPLNIQKKQTTTISH